MNQDRLEETIEWASILGYSLDRLPIHVMSSSATLHIHLK